MNLFKINKAIEEAITNGFVVDDNGELLFTADDIESLEMARNDKIDNIASFIKNEMAFVTEMKAAEKAMAERRKIHENKVESLKKYLSNFLDGNKFESVNNKVSFRKSVETIIDDSENLDKLYVVEKVTYTPDKTAIKNAINNGIEVEGTHLEEKMNIIIK